MFLGHTGLWYVPCQWCIFLTFFPVAELPPLFSSRSSKLDLPRLAADENRPNVYSLQLYDLLGLLPLGALVAGQYGTDGAFRSKEKPAVKVQFFYCIGLANLKAYLCV